MIIERKTAMANRETFTIKPIKDLIKKELTPGVWLDPFARNSKISNKLTKVITNDLNPLCNTDYHMEAKEFLKLFPDNYADGVLVDPPYSPRQIKESYNSVGIECKGKLMTSSNFHWSVVDEITRVVKPGGKVISFGWNSTGMSKKRGFEIKKILLVHHAGSHHDTICVVDKKVS